ncbi:uncharacterized protein [Porites lutea]|uniref:uncharacterized protein n=1 Tax=Porites lutea TaxID=51062 RepID=UPI003CC5A66D
MRICGISAKFSMRRSRRLAAKKSSKFSETEGSSQEEASDLKNDNEETLFSKGHDFVIDKTPSQLVTGTVDDHVKNITQSRVIVNNVAADDELSSNDSNDEEDGNDEDVNNLLNLRITSSQEDEGKGEDFVSLSGDKSKTREEKKIKERKGKREKDFIELSSELQVNINTDDLYFKFDKKNFKPVSFSKSFDDFAFKDKELMKRSVLTSDFEKRHSVPPMHVSQQAIRKQKKKAREETAGPMWYNLPATQMTPEIEQDMKIMKMRNILDRKRHYKKNDSSALPKYFQIGTVVEGSADFYSSRIPKRQRKNNVIDELLSDTEFRRYNKKKYLEIQAAKQSGKKGFYIKKMNKRKATWLRS